MISIIITMKNLFTLLLLFLVTTVNSQVKLTYQNHAYIRGDRHDFFLTQKVDEGKSGADVSWDFSDLVTSSNLTSYMVDPLTTEKGTMIPKANLALIENDNVFYFRVERDALLQYGSAGPCSVTMYGVPFEKMKFPFAYGDKVRGNFSGTIQNGEKYSDVSGSYSIEGDAWGSLVLPNGFYQNTLRVKQTRIMKISGGNDLQEITYRWYCANVRYPLLVIIKYENNGNTTTTQVAYNAHYPLENPKNNEEKKTIRLMSDLKLDVSPNPFVEQVRVGYHLDYTTNMTFELLNNSGVVVSILQQPIAKEAGTYSEILPVPSTLPLGTYYLKVTYGKLVIVKKIVKVN